MRAVTVDFPSVPVTPMTVSRSTDGRTTRRRHRQERAAQVDDQQERSALRSALDDGCDCPASDGIGHEVVAVDMNAGHRENSVPGDAPRVVAARR